MIEAIYEPELPIGGLPKAQDTMAQKFLARFSEKTLDAIENQAWAHVEQGDTYISMADIIGELRKLRIYINNNDASFYTDALIDREPGFAQFFHRRARANGKMKRVYA